MQQSITSVYSIFVDCAESRMDPEETSSRSSSEGEKSLLGRKASAVKGKKTKGLTYDDLEAMGFAETVTHTVFSEDKLDRISRWAYRYHEAPLGSTRYAMIYRKLQNAERAKQFAAAASFDGTFASRAGRPSFMRGPTATSAMSTIHSTSPARPPGTSLPRLSPSPFKPNASSSSSTS